MKPVSGGLHTRGQCSVLAGPAGQGALKIVPEALR